MVVNPAQGPAPVAKPAAPAAPAGEKKEPKAPKVKKERPEGSVARPRLPKYPDEHVITVLKENAKARGANQRFLRYKTGMTVKAYVEKIKEDFKRAEGMIYADLRWDENHKFIHIGPTVVPVPQQAQPATAKPAA